MTIFDLVSAPELASYWTELPQDEPPYVGAELFPADKKRGLDISWIKGSRGLPVVLKASAFDVYAVPRGRAGFEMLKTQMPYYKESMYIDEEMRQELNMVLETGNSAYIDAVMDRIFDDQMQLLRGAEVARERMRMQAVMTGVVTINSNGQKFSYDYGVPETHKGDAAVKWSQKDTADPIDDLNKAKEQILEDTGNTVTRGLCTTKTWRTLRDNDKMMKSIFVLTNGVDRITDAQLADHIAEFTGIRLVTNDKRYADESGKAQKFVPDGTVSLFPDGPLGKTWFGTTPAESDLMSSGIANVSVVDTGVAITTAAHHDPVNVETIVSMICLPSMEQADSLYILDTEPA